MHNYVQRVWEPAPSPAVKEQHSTICTFVGDNELCLPFESSSLAHPSGHRLEREPSQTLPRADAKMGPVLPMPRVFSLGSSLTCSSTLGSELRLCSASVSS